MGTTGRGVLFNMFFSLYYYYLFKKNKGHNIKFIVLGVFFLLVGAYLVDIMYLAYYNGAGESITNIFDIDRMSRIE